ncbi:Hypothetical predicted protein [Olea europaea subsp. europaea]|uniref:Uncharacterized protein n=1 Tax=Olea europaea subsp. europaea TaxID=158383 RepID=A0A8S0R3Z2_OLEEU|nr:Hypothetical predicted protein [Olea europaea subsp. europaea]
MKLVRYAQAQLEKREVAELVGVHIQMILPWNDELKVLLLEYLSSSSTPWNVYSFSMLYYKTSSQRLILKGMKLAPYPTLFSPPTTIFSVLMSLCSSLDEPTTLLDLLGVPSLVTDQEAPASRPLNEKTDFKVDKIEVGMVYELPVKAMLPEDIVPPSGPSKGINHDNN